MKALEIKDYGIPGGLVGIVAQSLARLPGVDSGPGGGDRGGVEPADGAPAQEGALERLGRWFWRQKRHGVEAELARSQDMFEALDRWLWKQQMRETEAWLAQSKDVFELEARIRRLERGPAAI